MLLTVINEREQLRQRLEAERLAAIRQLELLVNSYKHALEQGLGFLPIIFETTGQMHHEPLRHLPGTSLPCSPDPVRCPVEVLDVHPNVHPPTFDGARDQKKKGSSDAAPRSTDEDSRRPMRHSEELCGTLIT